MIKSSNILLVRPFRLTREERICLVYTAKTCRLLNSFLLSILSAKVSLQSSTPLCLKQFKGLIKVFLINFWEFTRFRYFTKFTLTVIKLIAKISYIASYVLFRIRATIKFLNSIICIAIYNPFLKLTCLLGKPGNVFH